MTKLFLKYCSIILAIWVVSIAFKSVFVRNVSALLIMGLVLLIINLVLKPILLIIVLPFNILTFGLFSFIVNALTIMIADGFVTGVHIGSFLNCLVVAFIIVLFNNLLIDKNKFTNRRNCE